MLENQYNYERLMELKQKDDMKKSREAWRHSISYRQGKNLFSSASKMLNNKKNGCCIECC